MAQKVNFNISAIMLLKGKDVQALLSCSHNYAYQVLKDIREEYKIKKVTAFHYAEYFKISLSSVLESLKK